MNTKFMIENLVDTPEHIIIHKLSLFWHIRPVGRCEFLNIYGSVTAPSQGSDSSFGAL